MLIAILFVFREIERDTCITSISSSWIQRQKIEGNLIVINSFQMLFC